MGLYTSWEMCRLQGALQEKYIYSGPLTSKISILHVFLGVVLLRQAMASSSSFGAARGSLRFRQHLWRPSFDDILCAYAQDSNQVLCCQQPGLLQDACLFAACQLQLFGGAALQVPRLCLSPFQLLNLRSQALGGGFFFWATGGVSAGGLFGAVLFGTCGSARAVPDATGIGVFSATARTSGHGPADTIAKGTKSLSPGSVEGEPKAS